MQFIKKFQLPISILLSIIILVCIFFVLQNSSFQLFSTKKEITEGVLVDTNFIGVKRVYPTSFNATELERSVANLIYEPLFEVDKNENIIPVLAESYTKNNLEYTIKLKSNVKFSNGNILDARDVIATFDAIRTKFGENAAQKLLQSITYNQIDDKTIFIKLNAITPTLFEDLQFGIMPAQSLSGLTDQFIGLEISKDPIGTGPFRKFSEDINEFKLVRNENYRNSKDIKFNSYTFKFFTSQTTLEQQLLSGNLNFTKNLRINNLQVIKSENLSNPNFSLFDNESKAISTRYWALYFNLKDPNLYSDEEKETLTFLQDINIRTAINLAINKEKLAKIISPKTEVMQNALSDSSWVNKNLSLNVSYFFDNTKAQEILNNAGYVMNANGFREKSGKVLSLKITYLKNIVRDKVVAELTSQLKQVGIQVTSNPVTDAASFNDEIIKTRQFQTLLLGMETYIDPDRARLWTESQISPNGLNISSFKTTQKVQEPITNKEVSKLDDVLARARNTEDVAVRTKLYQEFQKIISNEVPAIFLYQPNFNLIQNKNLQIDISNTLLPEEIYKNISNWNLK